MRGVSLVIFKFDPEYERNENKYASIRRAILGDSDSDEEDDSGASSDEESSDEEDEAAGAASGEAGMKIVDRTATNLINLRKTIYLAIMSSIDYEECCHKLMKMNIAEGQEVGFD